MIMTNATSGYATRVYHEANARTNKALAILDTIFTAGITANQMRQFDDQHWALAAAQVAGVNKPSPQTVKMIIDIAAVAEGVRQTDDPFADLD